MPNHQQHEQPPKTVNLTDLQLAEESEFWEAVRRETLRQQAEMEARHG